MRAFKGTVIWLCFYTGLVASQATDEIDLNALVASVIENEGKGTTAAQIPTTPKSVMKECPHDTHLCVPFVLCGNRTLTDNELNIDVSSGPCHYLLKCCPLMEIHEDRIKEGTPTMIVPTQTVPNSNKPVVVTVPSGGGNNNTSSRIQKCGMRNKDGLTFKITNARDHESEYGEFPWMVALLEETQVLGLTTNVYKCGGSLIHPRVVMTAAHCVTKKPKLIARIGEWDTQTESETIPHQDRKVTEIVVHEGFHKGGLFNDIALLILESPIERAENVGYVCLPRASATFDSIQCTASGWGAHTHGGVEQTILKKVDLPIVPRTTCQDLFRTLRKSDSYELHESYLCAGGLEGKDTCKGDGGSPLVCPTMQSVDQYFQAGIVSWGRGCGSHNVPGVYANVAVLRDWIDMKMTERNLDTFYYEL